MRPIAKTLLAAGFAALGAIPAHADAIDGLWCSQDGRRIVIEGSNVTTPGGRTITGQYGRHDFAFTVPAGEPRAGEPVAMRLRGEYRVMVTIGTGSTEEWNRCRPGIS